MDSSGLKSFAAGWRSRLIGEIGARVGVVLAPGSSERVELPGVVSGLETAISGAGEVEDGSRLVVERVAYMWFNRIVALRFMDVNGFTGVGVVSPAKGQVSGQPEVLADAKLGHFDSEVVDSKTASAVTGLLDGSRKSSDGQGEAYGLLLGAYCRHWNKAMPFMFEHAGDYSELLMPSGLLADGSFLSETIETLTAEVCEDVEVIGWLYQYYISERKDEVFAGFKKNKKAGVEEIPAATQLFTPHWIVKYLVENSLGRLWLLNNTGSKLASEMEYYIAPVDEEVDFLKISSPQEIKVMDPACGSGHMLTYAFDLLFKIYEEEGYSTTEIPTLILENNLFGAELDDRAGSLAAFALSMKAREKQNNFFSQTIQPNICVLKPIRFAQDELDELTCSEVSREDEQQFWNQFEHADLFGSLIQPNEKLLLALKTHLQENVKDTLSGAKTKAEQVIAQAVYLTQRYHVVVANPPYMGGGNMAPKLSEYAKQLYPISKSDLMTMFMERLRILAIENGYFGLIGFSSWMFLSSFEKLRVKVLEVTQLQTFIQLGRGVFGSDFGTAAFTSKNAVAAGTTKGFYRKLFNDFVSVRSNKAIKKLFLDPTYQVFVVKQNDFSIIPGSPLAYWLSSETRLSFAENPAVSTAGNPRVGMQTSNNNRFLRFWWEISLNELESTVSNAHKWVRYLKGGSYRKWYGNLEYVLHYEANGSEIIKQKNGTCLPLTILAEDKICWTDATIGAFSARIAPKDSFHDLAAHCFYPSSKDLTWLLAFANSKIFAAYLSILSPTVHYQVGDVGRVPLVALDREVLSANASDAIELAKRDWDSQELSWDFEKPQIFLNQCLLEDSINYANKVSETDVEKLRSLEEAINEQVAFCGMFGDEIEKGVLTSEVSLIRNPTFGKPNAGNEECIYGRIEELLSFFVGCLFGRYSLDEPGFILASQGETMKDYLARISEPTFLPDKDNVVPILNGEWFEDDIVSRFRQFLRASFGEEHFEENLRFIEDMLGKSVRDYFVSDFYKDHLQRYKKRPIYWMFSSPSGSFNALIYMHRYNPSTVSTVLNEYLREFQTKLEAEQRNQESVAISVVGSPRDKARAEKEIEKIRKMLTELKDYERDVLYPLATQQKEIDLDDGVLVNYLRFGKALAPIKEIEKKRSDVEKWEWPTNKLEPTDE